MEINEYQLKLTGSMSLAQPLEPDKTFAFHTEADIYEVSKRDNQDGTFNIVYKAKVIGAVDVVQGEKKFKGKDKSRVSQKIRGAAWHYANGEGIDEEAHYQENGKKIAAYWPEIVEFLKSKT